MDINVLLDENLAHVEYEDEPSCNLRTLLGEEEDILAAMQEIPDYYHRNKTLKYCMLYDLFTIGCTNVRVGCNYQTALVAWLNARYEPPRSTVGTSTEYPRSNVFFEKLAKVYPAVCFRDVLEICRTVCVLRQDPLVLRFVDRANRPFMKQWD